MTVGAVQTAVEKDGLTLPLIDFSLYLHGDSANKQEVAQGMVDGFRNAGFVYIKNHGISREVIRRVFAESSKFFARPKQQKEELSWLTPESNRGYVSQGREKVTTMADAAAVRELASANPDLKETMEIGRDGVDSLPNQLPDRFDEEGVEFTKTMREFFQTCKELHVNVMRSIALGMGLEEQFFDQYTDGGDNNLRLLHYPSVKKDVFEKNQGQVRAGCHTDYGSITLLFQDDSGGLQVRSPKGTFVDATPIPDTIVINAGDLLARWANHTIRSTEHQVVQPPTSPENDTYPDRYSVAYFCNPNFDKVIEAIPGTYIQGKSAEEGGKRYPGILSGDYLVQRLTATYTY